MVLSYSQRVLTMLKTKPSVLTQQSAGHKHTAAEHTRPVEFASEEEWRSAAREMPVCYQGLFTVTVRLTVDPKLCDNFQRLYFSSNEAD